MFDFLFSSIETVDLPFSDEDLPLDSLFFSVSGSSYHRRILNSSFTYSDRFRLCATTTFLEQIHEVKVTFSFEIQHLICQSSGF